MIFLKALFLTLIVIAILLLVVYAHIVLAISIYNLFRFNKEDRKNPFMYGWKFKGRSVLKLFIGFFIMIHLMLFADYYKSYINDNTKYHEAKVYYVAGMIPHTYSVLLGRFVTPLNPLFWSITKPVDAMKEYFFAKGSKLIPDTDAERELWEYEWFFYPYAIHFWDMYDKFYVKNLVPTANISKKTQNYTFKRVERLYKIMEALNTKKMADLYREAAALREMPLMVYYYKEKAQWFGFHNKFLSKKEMKKVWKTFTIKQTQLKKWLQTIPDKIDHQMQFQEWGNSHIKSFLKAEATREYIILRIMQDELFDDIRAGEFQCDSEDTKAYVDLRNRFMMGGKNSVLDRLVNYGGKKHALYLYNDLKNFDSAYYFQLMLKKYCSVNVLGESKYKSGSNDKSLLSNSGNGNFATLNKILDEGEVK